jgi:hypothetical protein
MAHLATRLGSFWNFDQHELMVTYEIYRDPRTRSQNNLYWKWLDEMANFYSTREQGFSKDDMHDLMRYQFLGCEDKVIGNTVISDQLKSTSSLKKDEMSQYMHKIEQWNVDKGLYLTIPAENEYMKYREAAQ